MLERSVRAGRSVQATSRALGVPQTTMSKWIVESNRAKSLPPSRFRLVQLKKDEQRDPSSADGAPQVVLVTPQGFRVEGLGLDELVTVLRSLA